MAPCTPKPDKITANVGACKLQGHQNGHIAQSGAVVGHWWGMPKKLSREMLAAGKTALKGG